MRERERERERKEGKREWEEKQKKTLSAEVMNQLSCILHKSI